MEIIVFLAVVGLYFLPSLVGSRKSNAGAIFLLNLFLGWTFVGWVVALVWASTNDPARPVIPPTRTFTSNQSSSSIDEISKLVALRKKGGDNGSGVSKGERTGTKHYSHLTYLLLNYRPAKDPHL